LHNFISQEQAPVAAVLRIPGRRRMFDAGWRRIAFGGGGVARGAALAQEAARSSAYISPVLAARGPLVAALY
jgi:hypothetical protein